MIPVQLVRVINSLEKSQKIKLNPPDNAFRARIVEKQKVEVTGVRPYCARWVARSYSNFLLCGHSRQNGYVFDDFLEIYMGV